MLQRTLPAGFIAPCLAKPTSRPRAAMAARDQTRRVSSHARLLRRLEIGGTRADGARCLRSSSVLPFVQRGRTPSDGSAKARRGFPLGSRSLPEPNAALCIGLEVRQATSSVSLQPQAPSFRRFLLPKVATPQRAVLAARVNQPQIDGF
jgi:hypothetical protein